MGLVALLVSTMGLPYCRTTLQFNIAESFDLRDEVSLKCCCSDTAPTVISLKGAAVKVKTSASPSGPHTGTSHCQTEAHGNITILCYLHKHRVFNGYYS